MELTIFHYHLLPGGVTSVIANALKAFREGPGEVEKIRVVHGKGGDPEALVKAATDFAQNIVFEENSLIGYSSSTDRGSLGALKTRLLTQYGGSTWWVHNYHLGKNPLFTSALTEIALKHPEQRMVFHIHDFPESGRWDNLMLLYSCLGKGLYPQGPNIRYAVINLRDYGYLLEAGVPKERVFYLPNALPSPGPSAGLTGKRGKEIKRLLSNPFPCLAEGPWALYPVRAIRRKNILEAALICRASDPCANLIVTLPGLSDNEKGYSSLVQAAFSKGLCRGAFGAGLVLEKLGIAYRELLQTSDIFISSSLQEGFGYLFLEAYQAGKSLLYRNLDTLEGLYPLFRKAPFAKYTKMLVPMSDILRKKLKKAYIAEAERIGTILSLKQKDWLIGEIETALSEVYVDYSLLPPEDQYGILQNTKDKIFLSDIRSINKEVLDLFFDLFCVEVKPEKKLLSQFCLSEYARKTSEVLNSFSAAETLPFDGSSGERIHENLFIKFTSLRDLRLIYRPLSDEALNIDF